MKNMKKWVVLTTITALMTLVAACSNSDNEPKSDAASATSSPAADNGAQKEAPVKIKMFQSDLSQAVPSNIKDDPTFKYLMEKTNTDLDWVYLPHGDYQNQLKLKYSSGAMPDVVYGWGIDADLQKSGQVLELNELLDKYGPNLKKNIPQASWDGVTVNGKIIGIPVPPQGNSPSARVLYVRKDWMDKVGITEIPKTPDEFLNMLRAFRDKDPNGNGVADEIPFTSRENLSWTENLQGMFGNNQYTWQEVNGELVPGYVNPKFKEFASFLSTMVQEKLIDSEFMTNKRNTWEQKITTNLAGSWDHVTDLAWDWQDKLNKSVPGADVIAIPTPRAPGADQAGDIMNPFSVVYTVSKSAKHPEAIIKMFDWLASDEGQEFVMLGVPGLTYNKDASGNIIYDKQKDTDMKTITWRINSFQVIPYNKELYRISRGEDAVKELDLAFSTASKEGLKNVTLGMPELESQKTRPDLTINGQVWREAISKIALGAEPIDYFDKFVSDWRAAGGNEIIKEATEWYNQNKK